MSKQVMSIFYEVREKGVDEVLDSNIGQTPLEFILGNGEVIPGLEEALLNAKEGEEHFVVVPPEKGYGFREEDAIWELPAEQFEGIELKQGMTLFGQGENGEHVQVIVQDFNDKSVIVDSNHPLAGKELEFKVQILGVREATENELLYGAGYEQFGGHHHGEDGCCGGGHGGGCCGRHHH